MQFECDGTRHAGKQWTTYSEETVRRWGCAECRTRSLLLKAACLWSREWRGLLLLRLLLLLLLPPEAKRGPPPSDGGGGRRKGGRGLCLNIIHRRDDKKKWVRLSRRTANTPPAAPVAPKVGLGAAKPVQLATTR